MTPERIVAALLALAVALAWARLLLGRRVRGVRLAMLLAAQPVLAGLLYLALFPPPVRGAGAAVLTVATSGAGAGADVALPEAPALGGVPRVPDLATALRRFPATRTVRVLGEGLEARDREAVRGLGVAFDPPPPRRGLVALVPPSRVAPGAAFRVGGEAADGRVAESIAVPVTTAAAAPLRVLFLAGAPGPEVKYWRRWAADAGLDASVGMGAGAGIELGDRVPALTPATLARVDVLVVDERRWAAIGGARGAVLGAVRGGMGLVLRVTGPVGVRVPGAPLVGRRGAKPVRFAGLPALTRWDALAPGAVTALRDEGGAPLFGWRAAGRGRIGVWTLGDAAGLVTAGFGDRYGAMWGEALAAVARPGAGGGARVSDWPVVGERMRVCGAEAVTAPDGARTALLAMPGPRCAGYWPRLPGWHVAGGTPFHVAEAAAIAGLRAEARRAATLALVGPGEARGAAVPPREGNSWPWFAAFLAVAGGLWWFERRRRGIAQTGPTP